MLLRGTLTFLAISVLGAGSAQAQLRVPPNARGLVLVAARDSSATTASVRVFDRTAGGWRLRFGPWPAELGWGGLRAIRREGDGATPIGVFGFGAKIYGNAPDPGGLHLAYHHLVCGDWWDEDPFSARYNRFVHVSCGTTPPFAARSEALWEETVPYPYFAVIDFNTDPTVAGSRAPGSGIFLHSWVGQATEGCVAIHRGQLLDVLRWLRPSRHDVIEIGTQAQVTEVGGSG